MKRRHFIWSTSLTGAHFLLTGDLLAKALYSPRKRVGLKGLALKKSLVDAMKMSGAYDVRIADPAKGFEHGISTRSPLKFFSRCRSVISIVIPNPPCSEEHLKKYRKDSALDVREAPVIHPLVLPIMRKVLPSGVSFLVRQGYDVYFDVGEKKRYPQLIQYKMCAYESGVGVYGKSGLILHPELGNRFAVVA